MGRPYAVKGRKKKRRLDEAAASDAAPPAEEAEELPLPEEAGGEEKEGQDGAAAVVEGEEHAAVEGEAADGVAGAVKRRLLAVTTRRYSGERMDAMAREASGLVGNGKGDGCLSQVSEHPFDLYPTAAKKIYVVAQCQLGE